MAVPRLHWLGCVVLIVAFSYTGRPAHAQSLVDAARLARARREALGPPTKVYTNEDLPGTRRITEPTLAWVSSYRSLLEAALERERALLELLREQSVMRPAPAPVPAKTVPPDPAPTPPTFGIPLYPVYSGYPVYLGYPVFVAALPNPQPRHSTMVSASPPLHRRGFRVRDHRSRIETMRRRATSGRRVDPSTRRPATRNGHEPWSRRFPYIAPGLPAPGVARNRTGGRASGAPARPEQRGQRRPEGLRSLPGAG